MTYATLQTSFCTGWNVVFTVNLLQRKNNDLLIKEIELLRETVKRVKMSYPFTIDAWVVLPDHIHCIWTLPPNNADFSTRWRLIKGGFSKGIPKTEYRSKVRIAVGERGIWQRHYWEHYIRDDIDYPRHVDYVHANPLKHGYVRRVSEWSYSSFHRYVMKGVYPENWCGDIDMEIESED